MGVTLSQNIGSGFFQCVDINITIAFSQLRAGAAVARIHLKLRKSGIFKRGHHSPSHAAAAVHQHARLRAQAIFFNQLGNGDVIGVIRFPDGRGRSHNVFTESIALAGNDNSSKNGMQLP